MNNYTNIKIELDKIAQSYVERGLNILNKYAELFSRIARHSCQPYYEIVTHNYEAIPTDDVCTQTYLNGACFKRQRVFECSHNLIIKFGIKYTQDSGCSAQFRWINGNEYYGSIEDSFRNEFKDLYSGFSYPMFEGENNVGMCNHSQTFRMECIIDFSEKITYDDFINISNEFNVRKDRIL